MDTSTPVTQASILAEITALEQAMRQEKKDIADLRHHAIGIWTDGLSEADKIRVENIKKELGVA